MRWGLCNAVQLLHNKKESGVSEITLFICSSWYLTCRMLSERQVQETTRVSHLSKSYEWLVWCR